MAYTKDLIETGLRQDKTVLACLQSCSHRRRGQGKTVLSRLHRQCVTNWCASCRLQLNTDKTETIWFGSQSNLAKLHRINQLLQVGPSNIQANSVVHDMGVYLDLSLIHI